MAEEFVRMQHIEEFSLRMADRFLGVEKRMEEGFAHAAKEREQNFVQLNQRLDDVNNRFDDMNRSVDQRFGQVDKRFDDMNRSMDQRFDQVDKRFDDMSRSMDQRFDQVDKRLEDMNKRITMLMVIASPIVVAFVGMAVALVQLIYMKM